MNFNCLIYCLWEIPHSLATYHEHLFIVLIGQHITWIYATGCTINWVYISRLITRFGSAQSKFLFYTIK